MPTGLAPFVNSGWTKRRTLAAQLVAEDSLTDVKIAAQLGRSLQWLEVTKRYPEFKQRVHEIREEMRQDIYDNSPIADKARRIQAKDERWKLLQRILNARAADRSTDGIPGADTGLIVREPKLIKVYGASEAGLDDETLMPTKDTVIMYEAKIDEALLAEMRKLEREAAEEMNQLPRGTGVSFNVDARKQTMNVNTPEPTSVEIDESDELRQFVAAVAELGFDVFAPPEEE